MANVASGDWTVTYRNGNRNLDTQIAYKKRTCQLKMTLAASGKTWPKAGVPLPAYGSMGMVRYLESVTLEQGPIDAVSYASGVVTSTGRAHQFAIGVTGKKLYAYRVNLCSMTGLAVRRLTSGDSAITLGINLYVTARGW